MGGYSLTELKSILVMQGFNGLSLFCVLLLMALGLAIIFGQMGVINMAHGEFLTIGAYTTYVLSTGERQVRALVPQLLLPLCSRRVVRDRRGRRLRRRAVAHPAAL